MAKDSCFLEEKYEPLAIFGQTIGEKRIKKMQALEQSRSGLRWRVVFTVLLGLTWLLARAIFGAIQGPVEGSLAVAQVQDDIAGYSFAHAVANGLLPSLLNWSVSIVLALVWVTYFLGAKKTAKAASTAAPITALVVLVLGAIGCGPARVEQFVEIKPNETAYVIPLEGASQSGQAKFDSVQFLEQKKVAAKRISLGLRQKSTGRMWYDYEYIATDRVITVDRAPITREWTANPNTGTSNKDQSLHMQSLDSIPIHIGATITASISESDASVYLYNYGGKPLHEVVDSNIRTYILGELTTAFAAVNLAEGQKDKADFFAKAGTGAKEYFRTKGISIDYFGIEGGIGYDNAQVQASLDQKYIAENDKNVAKNEQAAQVIRNETAIAKAQADAKAASMFAANIVALNAKTENEIKLTYAQAKKIAAEKWNGGLPANVVPESGAFIFDLNHSGK
jgi:hypothetical protein